MIKALLVSLFLLVFITACAQDFASTTLQQSPQQQELDSLAEQGGQKSVGDEGTGDKQEYQKARGTRAGVAGEYEDKVESSKEESEELFPPKQPKNTEEKCREIWSPLIEYSSPLMMLEEGRITVLFAEYISYKEALAILLRYNVEKDQVIEILPLGEKQSDEQKYNNYRRIKGKVLSGEEISVACKILQDKDVEEATPSTTTDLAKLAQISNRR